MVTWFWFGVLSVRPGVSSARKNGVRPTGNRRVASTRRLTAPAGAAIGVGAAALTLTVSRTVSGRSVESTTSGEPSGTDTRRSTWAKPGIATRTV